MTQVVMSAKCPGNFHHPLTWIVEGWAYCHPWTGAVYQLWSPEELRTGPHGHSRQVFNSLPELQVWFDTNVAKKVG